MNVLNTKVLVLNKSWLAIGIITLKRAIRLVYSEDALIVGEDYQKFLWSEWEKFTPKEDEPFISSFRSRYLIPRVIILTVYDKLPRQNIKFSKKALFRRDDHSCMYCGIQPGDKNLTTDHVIPRSIGGKTDWLNCVTACNKCNAYKANRTPEQAKMKFISGFNPFKPKFHLFKSDVKVDAWIPFLPSI